MKKNQVEGLIKDFNNKDTILVISKYPYKNIGDSFHGVAVYTKNTLEAIAKRTKQKFVVLVQDEYQRQPELINKQILVLPVFSANKWQMFSQLNKTIKKFSKVENIQIHSEFYNSGDLLQMILLLPFLYRLRVSGKCISYIAHNVVNDLAFLAKHLSKNKESLKLQILTKLIPFYYSFLSLGVYQFVTLDKSIQERLQSYLFNQEKVKNTNIWLKENKLSKNKIENYRQELGFKQSDFVLAVYGFMSQYKGVDDLVKNFKKFKKNNPESKVKLLLAGGMAPSKKDQAVYQKFYADLEKAAIKNKDIILTGFIAQKELNKYYSVADLAILPYKGILGASASLASILSYAKPFVLSEELVPYLKADDIQEINSTLRFDLDNLIVARDYKSFEELLLNLSDNQRKFAKMTQFSKYLAHLRSEDYCVFKDFPPLYFPKIKKNSWVKLFKYQ